MPTSLPQPRPAAYLALASGLIALFPLLFAAWTGFAALFRFDPLDGFQPAGIATLLIAMTVSYAERGSRWSRFQKTTQVALTRYVRTIVWIPIIIALPCVVLDVLAFGSNCLGRGCAGDLNAMLILALAFCAIGAVLLIGNWRYLREPVTAASEGSARTRWSAATTAAAQSAQDVGNRHGCELPPGRGMMRADPNDDRGAPRRWRDRMRLWFAILLPIVIGLRAILLVFQLHSEHHPAPQAMPPLVWPPSPGQRLRFGSRAVADRIAGPRRASLPAALLEKN